MIGLLTPWLVLLLGIVLLASEVFVPSAGLLGMIAVVCLAASPAIAFRQSRGAGLSVLLAEGCLTPLTVGASIYYWPKTRMARLLTLTSPRADEIAISHDGAGLDDLVGRRGLVLTPLRPSGYVEIDGRKWEARCESGLLDEGTRIVAVEVRGGRLVVQRDPYAETGSYDQPPDS